MIDINNEVYDNPWTFDGDIFTSGDIKEYYGFVYCITNTIINRQYIGRKYFWAFRTPKGKKKKTKTRIRLEKVLRILPRIKR